MLENKSSLYRDETKIFYMVYMEEFFSKIFCPILSSLVFQTVTIQVIPHYYKQSLVQ